MDFKSFLQAAPHVIKAKLPIMLRGMHGIGKSEVVYQIAKDLELNVIERRASQMTEGDLCGMPKIEGKCTAWLPPEFYMEACERPVVLFLDELDRAITEVRQGFFELADSRKLNGHKLHEGTLIFAAINGGPSGQHYDQVFQMGPAENDRWWIVDLEPTVEDWLKWAYNNCNIVIYEFISHNPSFLEHKDVYDPTKVYPSRRSWKRFNDVLECANLLDNSNEQNLNLIMNLGVGFVGFESTVKLVEFIKDYDFQVTLEEFFAGKANAKIQNFDMHDHASLIQKIEDSNILSEKTLTDDEAIVLARYAMQLPAELQLHMMTLFAKQNQNIDNFFKFVGFEEKDGSDIVGMIVDVYANGDLNRALKQALGE